MEEIRPEFDFSAVLVYDPKVGMNRGWLFPDWPSAEGFMAKSGNPLEAKAFLMAELKPSGR